MEKVLYSFDISFNSLMHPYFFFILSFKLNIIKLLNDYKKIYFYY